MTKSRKRRDDIDPTVQRQLGESAAHNAKSREMISTLAKDRGGPAPETPPPNNEFAEELITARHDIEELQRLAARSNPEFSLRAPGGSGFRIAGVAGWQILIVVIALAALAAWAWVETHSIRIAAPVTQPPPAAAPATPPP